MKLHTDRLRFPFTEPERKTTSRAFIATALVAFSSLLLLQGCRKPASIKPPPASSASVDPWEATTRKLSKETDFAACQSTLRTLNENLRNDESFPRPVSLAPESEATLASIVPLSPADREELHSWTYSNHDPSYLAECFYLRDVAQSLRLPNLTPEQLADLGFAWVCRSVSLRPLTIVATVDGRSTLVATALPPTYILRRGYGSALERMYVFLALLQQLELEGCLIGPAGAREVGSYSALGTDRTPSIGGPDRPFWGIGVRIGSDVKVYDPWREEAFPATLSQLKSNPEAHKSWFESSANLSKVKPDDARAAATYLAVPVNSLSPRMEMLHNKLKPSLGVRLAIDPFAFRAAFPDPKPSYWNPPEDRFAYGRAARTFLPHDRGGSDDSVPPNQLIDLYMRDQLPAGLMLSFAELRGADTRIANDRLQTTSATIYVNAFLEPPCPRERIQRAHFQDAIRDLIEKRDIFRKYRETLRHTTDVDAQIADWCSRAKVLYGNLARTVIIPDRDERAMAVAEAQMAIEKLWHDDGGPVSLMIGRMFAPICDAEATYLLALCKHEMAERKQTRADYATGEDKSRLKEEALESWSEATRAWETYLEASAPQENIPGRISEALVLKNKAAKLSEKK